MFGKSKQETVNAVSDSVFLVHPAFDREDRPIVPVKKGSVDSAGYRPIAAMVQAFRKAGVQLAKFYAAEFSGDLAINPLHAAYIDPVDRDSAIQDAIQRGKKARKDYDIARRAALDKRKQKWEDDVIKVAETLQRSRDARTRTQVGTQVPSEGEAPTQ